MQLLKVYLQETGMRLPTELVPLFFLTYIAHILRQHAFGIQVWTYALVMLTIGIFSTAIRLYAQTELNKMPPDKKGNSHFFWGVWSIQVLTFAVLALLTYGFVQLFDLPYEGAIRLQLLFYVGAMLDISWLFNGINKTRIVVRRDAIIQMARFVPLIIFVKSPDDLAAFILLLAITTIIGNVVMWFKLPQTLVRVDVARIPIRRHMRLMTTFFLAAILPQLALYLNKVLLFWHDGVDEVASYYSAELMVKVGIALVLGIGIAMMGRVVEQRRQGDASGVQQSFYDAVENSTALAIIIAVGVAIVGSQTVYWFLGIDYEQVGAILHVLAFVIVVASWRYSLALQQLAAERGFRNLSMPVQIATGLNVVLSLALIPWLGVMAAAWIALVSEIVALVLQLLSLRHVIHLWRLVAVVWRYIVAGVVTAVVLIAMVRAGVSAYPKYSALEAAVGLVVYALVVVSFDTPVAKATNQVLLFSGKRMFESTIEFIRIVLRIKK